MHLIKRRLLIGNHRNLTGTCQYTNTPGFVHNWKINDYLAQKSGFRKTIVTLKGNSYTGEWYDNKKEGDGHQIWAESGKEYKGTWKNDMRHGMGTLWEPINPPTPSKSRPSTTAKFGNSTSPSRSSTRGGTARSQIGSPKILGIIDPEDNENLRLMYEGGWLWDKMHGNGRRHYRNGDIYDGEWVNGERHGFGTMDYANGDVYEGEWVNGKRHGKGVLFYQKDGNRYEGFWSNDKKDGKGTFYYSAKKQKMDGEWLEDICKCGTMVEFDTNNNEEWQKNSGRKSSNSSPSTSLSSISIPAASLPPIYLIDSEKVLKEQEELVQKMREMKGTKIETEESENGEEDRELEREEEEDYGDEEEGNRDDE